MAAAALRGSSVFSCDEKDMVASVKMSGCQKHLLAKFRIPSKFRRLRKRESLKISFEIFGATFVAVLRRTSARFAREFLRKLRASRETSIFPWKGLTGAPAPAGIAFSRMGRLPLAALLKL